MTTEDHIALAEAELRAAKRGLSEEISAYPTPIAGCDAQFNHLLAQRQRVTNALAAIEAAPFIATPRQPSRGDRPEAR
ncbi:MAG: hypothetical protein AAF401_08960 [Pseudomonadota bacterium]